MYFKKEIGHISGDENYQYIDQLFHLMLIVIFRSIL